MGLSVLAALGRNTPGTSLGVDLHPGHLGDFLPALTGQNQHVENSAEWHRHSPSGNNDVCEFGIVQNAVAADFLARIRNALSWGKVDDRSTHAPPEKCLQDL